MSEKQAGQSAVIMAYTRAYHATHDSQKIFDDFLAAALFTPEEHAQIERDWAGLLQYSAPELAALKPDPATALAWVMQLGLGPLTLARSRYTEDGLEEAMQNNGSQYILLGAGLDTFAYRRPDFADRFSPPFWK